MIARSALPLTIASLAVVLMSACGGGGNTSTNVTDTTTTTTPTLPAGPQAKATIGSGGGTVGFSDGRFTLTVPAGALSNDTQITVIEISGNDIPAELRSSSVRKVYDMQPDGLQFTTPATVEIHTTGSATPPDGTPLVGLISDSKGTLELLGPLTDSIDDAGITVIAPVSHFSSVASVESFGFTASLTLSPQTLPVGADFKLTLAVTKSSDSGAKGTLTTDVGAVRHAEVVSVPSNFVPPSFTLTAGESQSFTREATGTCELVGNATLAVGGQPGDGEEANYFEVAVPGGIGLSGGRLTFAILREVTCTKPPTLSGLHGLVVQARGTAGETFQIDGEGPFTVTATSSDQNVLPDKDITGQADCTAKGDCTLTVAPQAEGSATVTVTLKDVHGFTTSGTFGVAVSGSTTSGVSISLGTHGTPNGASSTETLSLLGASFAGMTGDLLGVFSEGETNSYLISDLSSTNRDFLRRMRVDATGTVRGATPMVSPVEAARNGDAIILFGTGTDATSVDNYDPGTGQWTDTPISGSGSDASQAGGALDGGEVVLTQLDGVHFITQTQAGPFMPTAEVIPGTSLGGNGGPISAFEASAGGPVLVASIAPLGSSPANGSLFLALRDGSAPVEVGKVGVEPRRVRCLNGICVVTNNTDNTVTIILWDGVNMPTIVGTAPVGNGPVGLDLATLSDGNTVIGTTGYNDNTYTLTEVASDGSVVSSTTQSVDSGCISPVSLAFFDDSQGKKAALVCYNAANYDIVPVELNQ